jgi:hypothetical protein
MVSFTPQPIYTRGKISRYPLDKLIGRPQGQSGRYREEKILTPAGNRTPAMKPIVRHYVDWAIPTPVSLHIRSSSLFINNLLIRRYTFWDTCSVQTLTVSKRSFSSILAQHFHSSDVEVHCCRKDKETHPVWNFASSLQGDNQIRFFCI